MKKKLFLGILMIFLAAAVVSCGGGGDGDGNEDSNNNDPLVNNADQNTIDDDGDGFTENEGDCNDQDSSIYPGAQDFIDDGVDQDCDGQDATAQPSLDDVDDDGDGVTVEQGDCDDQDSSIYPGAQDFIDDGIDQDCDGQDATAQPSLDDVDDDGDGVTVEQGDCDDQDSSIFPGAHEIPEDGVDQNCDGEDGQKEVSFQRLENDVETAINEDNASLYMSRVSDRYFDNGQDAACYRQYLDWYLAHKTFTEFSFSIVDSTVSEDGQSAQVTASITYARPTSYGTPITLESQKEYYLVFESDRWLFYGDQSNMRNPELTFITTSGGYDPETGEIKDEKTAFSDNDEKIHVVFSMENIRNDSNVVVRIYRPDGMPYDSGSTSFKIDYGEDYPDCSPIIFKQSHSFSIQNLEGVPGMEGPDNEGTWKIKILLDGFLLLAEKNFTYAFQP